MKLVTQHYYRGDAHKPEATMDHLLAHDKMFDTRLNALQDLCDRNRLDYRINEVNSFYNGGKAGSQRYLWLSAVVPRFYAGPCRSRL